MNETRKPRILLVEDDSHSRKLLGKVLGAHNLDVTAAADGLEGWNLLQSDPSYDLILSDWSMPELDGVEFCSRIRGDEDLRLVYFILLTSKEELEDKIRALDMGVDDYLIKPCHSEELLARIRVGLRIRSLQREILELEKRMAILKVATTAGHEINNPLTGIFGYLELLRDGIETGASKEDLNSHLDRIFDQSKRIRNIVSRLVSLKDVRMKRYLGRQEMLDLDQDEEEVPEEITP